MVVDICGVAVRLFTSRLRRSVNQIPFPQLGQRQGKETKMKMQQVFKFYEN